MVENLFQKVSIVQFIFIIIILTALIIILNRSNHQNTVDFKRNRSKLKITETTFGTIRDREVVKKYSLKNANHLELDLISYGATIKSLYIKDKNRYLTNVVLGFNTLEGQIFLSVSKF